jgi:hypothetical protein
MIHVKVQLFSQKIKNPLFRNRFSRCLPQTARNLIRKIKIFILRERNRRLSITEAFSLIYEKNVWGGRRGQFYSGSGSQEIFTAQFIETVNAFIHEKSIQKIVDLGCGDFSVASRLALGGITYIGVDVVPKLIEFNRQHFGGKDIVFKCLNIIDSPLPAGDLCILRQVLQHLSNSEISVILKKISAYRYVIITEHYPSPEIETIPNIDKPHGSDTRTYDNSAVYLDRPPFNVKDLCLLFETKASPLVNEGEVLRTFLIENHV